MEDFQYVEVCYSHSGRILEKEIFDISAYGIGTHINDILRSGHKVAFVDLDGTLRGGGDRLHLLPTKEDFEGEKVDPNSLFAEFNKQCGVDTVIQHNVDTVVELQAKSYFIVLLTSCTAYPESIKSTLKQMKDWNVPFDTLIMRSEHNQEDAIEMKVTFFKKLIEDSINFRDCLIFDDNLKTIEACSSMGISTIVAHGGEMFKHHGDKYNNVSSK